MSSPHDRLFRRVFARPAHALGLLHRVLPAGLAAAVDWATLSECSGILVDAHLERREADLLFRARRRPSSDRPPGDCGTEVLFLLEHKSEQDPLAVLQVLGYAHRLWEWHCVATARDGRGAHRPLPQIVPILLHHGQRSWLAATALSDLLPRDDADDSIQPTFPVLMLDLARCQEREILGWDLPPMARLALLHLQFARWLPPDQLDDALCRWAPLFTAAAAPPGSPDRLQVFHSYVLKVTDLPAGQLASRMADILGPRGRSNVMSTADKLIAKGKIQGRAEGREEGLAKGLAEGLAKGRATQLLLLLHQRFGPAAAAMATRVRTGSPTDLDRWALRVLDAATLAEVFATE